MLQTYRMFAYDEGWARRINEAIDSGLTAEAAIERVQQRTRQRMRQIDDPLLLVPGTRLVLPPRQVAWDDRGGRR